MYLALLVNLISSSVKFINHLFHDDCPVAMDLSYAGSRSELFTFLVRQHSLGMVLSPFLEQNSTCATCCLLFPGWLAGVCGLRALFGRWHVVGALNVGFLCMLHTVEIMTLAAGQITLSVVSCIALVALRVDCCV